MKTVRRSVTTHNRTYRNDKKLFGKYNQLLIIFITFILTTVCGSFLAYFFQERNWEKQHEDNLIKAEREVAEKVFSEVSSIMDERMYIMWRIFWSYKFNMSAVEKNKRWAEYEAMLMKWNSNLNKNFSLLEIYFGTNFRNTFERKIHSKFREIGELLEGLKGRKNIEAYILEEIYSKQDTLNEIFYGFNIRMLSSIRDNKIGKSINNK